MRGLILKDLYMAWKYCKAYLLILVGFLMMTAGGHGNSFFLIYPSILCGLVPMSVLAYDELCSWHQYSLTLPYTRTQLVSAKYLVGLMCCILVIVLTGLVLGIRMVAQKAFSWAEWGTLTGTVVCCCFVGPALSMPFLFKLGPEKGRIFYSISIGIICAVAVILAMSLPEEGSAAVTGSVMPVACLVSVAFFAFSWWLSIRFYRKREF